MVDRVGVAASYPSPSHAHGGYQHRGPDGYRHLSLLYHQGHRCVLLYFHQAVESWSWNWALVLVPDCLFYRLAVAACCSVLLMCYQVFA